MTSVVRYHNSAASLLASCQQDMMTRERDANIILPFALKAAKSPASGPVRKLSRSNTILLPSADSDTDSDEEIMRTPVSPTQSSSSKDEQFWLSVWTRTKLDIVVSCTTGPIGKYPIFLYSNVPDEVLTSDWVKPRIELLVKRLRACLPAKRVFSVFGPVPLTRTFVNAWSSATCATPVIDPYYAAKHTFCTRETLSPQSAPLPAGHELRLADSSDLIRASELCYGFAYGSEPFVLSCEDAIKEARGYINNRQLYVYNIKSTDGTIDTASIVCVTRSSQNVSAITKVYTNPHHRGKKCAEKLVRFVCQQMLYDAKKSSVVLFVAHDNLAAEKVYDRVGFQGLCGKPRPEGVSDWVEIGFEDTELGHW